MSRSSPFYGSSVRNAAYFSPPPPPSKPKVVSIPVHFVGEDNGDKKRSTGSSQAAAATIIQSAFRGFLVRKNVKVVRAIETEVDEIEMRFRRDYEKEADLMVRDDKERLKINEMLMRLLFRLDSVRGVRDYRKRVIRRVITIQEMLDSIFLASQTLSEVEALEDAGDQVPESMEMLQDRKPEEADQVHETMGMLRDSKSGELETLEVGDQVVETAEAEELEPDVVIEESKTLETAGGYLSNGWELVNHDMAAITENREESAMAVDGEENREESAMDGDESVEIPESALDSKRESPLDSKREEEKVGSGETASGETSSVGMKDMMERMVAENEKLKGLVVELCKRSAQQCRLMGGLAERVEHLEKVVEKMERRKKKKRKHASLPPPSSIDKKHGSDDS